MKQIIQTYGRFLLEAAILVFLVTILFTGIRDNAGNRGMFAMTGARLDTGGTDHAGYGDFDIYHTESTKAAPVIRYTSTDPMKTAGNNVTDYIQASDYSGNMLQLKVLQIMAPDGADVTSAYNPDTGEASFTIPGIYSFQVTAVDDGNRRATCDIRVPVSGI